MANKVSNVAAAKPAATGGVLVAPIGTALPVDEAAAPNVAFKSLGYAGEGGVTRAESRSTDKKKAWGGSIVKSLQTEYGVTYKVILIEHYNPDVQTAIHGAGSVTITAATVSTGTKIAIAGNSATLPRQSWIFEMFDGPAKTRHVLPNAQITEVGDVVYDSGDLIAYEATIDCFEDATGKSYYEYLNDGVFA